VANVVKAALPWQYTGKVIQEKNCLYAPFVANDLLGEVTL